jgi:hypothetical protein
MQDLGYSLSNEFRPSGETMKTSATNFPARLQYFDKRWQYAAAILSMLAGWIHVFLAPEHFEEWVGYGVFFVVVSSCQMLFSLMVVTNTPPRREVLWAGILGNTALIALWGITRTIGIPFFGPSAGEVEKIGPLDLTAQIAEFALIACLIILLRSSRNRVTRTERS